MNQLNKQGFKIVNTAPTAHITSGFVKYRKTQCTHCGKYFNIDEKDLGKVKFCFYCGDAFQVR